MVIAKTFLVLIISCFATKTMHALDLCASAKTNDFDQVGINNTPTTSDPAGVKGRFDIEADAGRTHAVAANALCRRFEVFSWRGG